MSTKTCEGWKKSGKALDVYLDYGDAVDEDLVWYLIECMPPPLYGSTVAMLGEPQDHNGEGYAPRYITALKVDETWRYAGPQTIADVRSGKSARLMRALLPEAVQS